MKNSASIIALLLVSIASLLLLAGCGKAHAQTDGDAASTGGAPPAANVVPFPDAALFSVDHPEQFPVTTAAAYSAAAELKVTGVVSPDVSRNVPVI